MAQAIVARNQGDEYQARWFWMNVCRLFEDRTKVFRVNYEQHNIKSFDDIAISYGAGMTDEDGHPLVADYYQVKFHVTAAGAITWQGMMNPAFINAASVSLLQRLKHAQGQYASGGIGARFYLYTPWSIDAGDPLASIVSRADGRIMLQRLADGGQRSKMGKARAAWREHLAVETDKELLTILRPLRLRQGPTLQELREALNLRLQLAGLVPVEEGSLIHPYDELTRKLLQAGQTSFTRTEIEQVCKREKLWRGHSVVEHGAYRMGIRSFFRWAEHLEDETDDMLCLLACLMDANHSLLDCGIPRCFRASSAFCPRCSAASRTFTCTCIPMPRLHLQRVTALTPSRASMWFQCSQREAVRPSGGLPSTLARIPIQPGY